MKVKKEDLLQPTHPEFKKVYPKAWEKIQSEKETLKRQHVERENRLDRALWKADKVASKSRETRYARDKFLYEHPEFKEV